MGALLNAFLIVLFQQKKTKKINTLKILFTLKLLCIFYKSLHIRM